MVVRRNTKVIKVYIFCLTYLPNQQFYATKGYVNVNREVTKDNFLWLLFTEPQVELQVQFQNSTRNV